MVAYARVLTEPASVLGRAVREPARRLGSSGGGSGHDASLDPVHRVHRSHRSTRYALLAILGACGRQPKATAARSDARQAPIGGFSSTRPRCGPPFELPAQLYVEHDAVVVARSAGTSIRCWRSSVTACGGAALARLENTDQKIALAQADASYENSSTPVAGRALMTKAGGMTVADSEQVEFQFRQADIARRKAQHDIELTRIVAPFAGVVTARYARAGRFVAVGDTLFRVTEPAPLFARVRVPEAAAASVHVGDHATVADRRGATAGAHRAAPRRSSTRRAGRASSCSASRRPRGCFPAQASACDSARSRATSSPSRAKPSRPTDYVLVVDNGEAPRSGRSPSAPTSAAGASRS